MRQTSSLYLIPPAQLTPGAEREVQAFPAWVRNLNPIKATIWPPRSLESFLYRRLLACP